MRPAKTKKAQKGLSLYLALMIMIFILSVSLGISVIIITQLKIIRGIEDSVVALYAADSGVELVLYKDRMCRQLGCGTECISGCEDGLTENQVGIPGTTGSINGIPVSYLVKFTEGAMKIDSVGTFNGTKRAVQVTR